MCSSQPWVSGAESTLETDEVRAKECDCGLLNTKERLAAAAAPGCVSAITCWLHAIALQFPLESLPELGLGPGSVLFLFSTVLWSIIARGNKKELHL